MQLLTNAHTTINFSNQNTYIENRFICSNIGCKHITWTVMWKAKANDFIFPALLKFIALQVIKILQQIHKMYNSQGLFLLA